MVISMSRRRSSVMVAPAKKHEQQKPSRGAPNAIKKILRTNYSSFFGPGGILEQEDSEAWMQQYLGSNIDFADDKPYFYGLGLGEEKPHPDLPGMLSVTANEYYARAFFSRWRSALEAVNDTYDLIASSKQVSVDDL